MTSAAPPIRWAYSITGGVIALGFTLASILLIVGVTGHGAPGPDGRMDPIAIKITGLVQLSLGSAFCFLMGWWAGRRAGDRFEEHGTIVGATTACLSGIAAIFGRSTPVAFLVPMVVVYLFAGRAGGHTAARMAGRGGA